MPVGVRLLGALPIRAEPRATRQRLAVTCGAAGDRHEVPAVVWARCGIDRRDVRGAGRRVGGCLHLPGAEHTRPTMRSFVGGTSRSTGGTCFRYAIIDAISLSAIA